MLVFMTAVIGPGDESFAYKAVMPVAFGPGDDCLLTKVLRRPQSFKKQADLFNQGSGVEKELQDSVLNLQNILQQKTYVHPARYCQHEATHSLNPPPHPQAVH